MADLFPSTIRPALAQDRWQIQTLLSNFDRETPRSSRRLHYLVLGLLTALMINLVLLLGLRVLWMILSLVGLGGALALLGIIFSKEWQKFWIIEQNGRVIACGKLCCYPTYSMLYNVLVAPEYRSKGIGSALVTQLAQTANKPLYLACYPNKVGFYTRLGFVEIRSGDLSPMLRHELGISTRSDIVPLVLR
jgi:N-acetylglutamate synthase-like GNAT family acetyltransferase